MNILTSEDVDSITSASNNVTLMVSFLDKKGLGILNLFDNVGRTMLHLVIDCSGNVACVQLLLEKRGIKKSNLLFYHINKIYHHRS